MTILYLFLFFREFKTPAHEKIVYQGYDRGTTREIVREFFTEDSFYTAIQHHLDETDLTMKVRISKKDFSTLLVYKKTEGKEAYFLKKKDNYYVFRLNHKKWKRLNRNRIYDRHTLFEVFRFYPFENPETIEFPLYEARYGMVVKGICEYRGIDTVKTFMVEIECYKLVLKIEKGVLGAMAKALLRGRELQFYYEKKLPHRFIKWTDGKDGAIIIKRIEKG